MIALDANILIYAHRMDSEWHAPAAKLVKTLAEDARPWAIPWPCVHEFVAIVTSPKIYRPSTTLHKAIDQLDIWMESPSLLLLGEREGYWKEFMKIATTARIVGGAIHDARIAAICCAHGVNELWTADRDFGRFPQLKTKNPLI